MKKILLLLLCLPMMAFADGKKDDTKYLAGAVPEENGQVIFKQAFAVKDKSRQEIYDIMKKFLTDMMEEDNQLQKTSLAMADPEKGILVGRFEEWLVFKKKPLMLDRTRFRYLYTIHCEEGACRMNITQISYYYEEDNEGNNGRTFRAEEWINDENALNKSRTKLIWGTARFRRKTVDRIEEIFSRARLAFEAPVTAPKATELLNE